MYFKIFGADNLQNFIFKKNVKFKKYFHNCAARTLCMQAKIEERYILSL